MQPFLAFFSAYPRRLFYLSQKVTVSSLPLPKGCHDIFFIVIDWLGCKDTLNTQSTSQQSDQRTSQTQSRNSCLAISFNFNTGFGIGSESRVKIGSKFRTIGIQGVERRAILSSSSFVIRGFSVSSSRSSRRGYGNPSVRLLCG
jgi:hypothetical protein